MQIVLDKFFLYSAHYCVLDCGGPASAFLFSAIISCVHRLSRSDRKLSFRGAKTACGRLSDEESWLDFKFGGVLESVARFLLMWSEVQLLTGDLCLSITRERT